MSLRSDLDTVLAGLPIAGIGIDKEAWYHGERATMVTVVLDDRRSVTGTFTHEGRAAFGGVEFAGRKDIPALMRSKIDSLLAGTAES